MFCKQFTYSGDPSSSTRDEVRFLMGDTVRDRPMFGDPEIDFQLTRTPNTRIASAELMLIKANEFARQADIQVGDVSKAFSKVAENLKKCADALRAEALKSAMPFFGGLTHSGKQALSLMADDVQPQFSIGQNDDPAVAQLNRDYEHLQGLTGGF